MALRLTYKIGHNGPLKKENVMEKKYWVSAIVVLALGVGTLGVASAKQKAFGAFGAGALAFEDIDANSDGKISKEEMANLEQLRFKKADSNNDGQLSEAEMAEQAKLIAAKIVKRIIENKDANGDGMLSAAEISADHKGKSRGGNRIFERLDVDNDGALTAKEFAKRGEQRGKWGKRHQRKDASE